MGAALGEIVGDLAADPGRRTGHDRDVARELRRWWSECELEELERPVLEVVNLGLREPARPAEAVEGRGDGGMAVLRELEPACGRRGCRGRPLPRRKLGIRNVRGGTSRALTAASMSSSSPSTQVHAPIRSMWSGVLRIAATRSTSGAVRERLLGERGAEDLPAFARKPAAKPYEEALDDASVGLADPPVSPAPEIVVRQPDELERQPV